MKKIRQQPDFSISDDGAMAALAEKERARLIVVSDSHGSPAILFAILAEFGCSADALCFCGDGIPDVVEVLERYYERNLAEEIVPPCVIFVRGNGDNSTCPITTEKHGDIKVPGEQTFTAAGTRIFMTHGHRYDVYYGTKSLVAAAKNKEASLVFYGHTHISNVQTKQKIMLINPGSCACPRGGLPHTFAIVDINRAANTVTSTHFELQWNANGEIGFAPYSPSTKEINLLW